MVTFVLLCFCLYVGCLSSWIGFHCISWHYKLNSTFLCLHLNWNYNIVWKENQSNKQKWQNKQESNGLDGDLGRSKHPTWRSTIEIWILLPLCYFSSSKNSQLASNTLSLCGVAVSFVVPALWSHGSLSYIGCFISVLIFTVFWNSLPSYTNLRTLPWNLTWKSRLDNTHM